MGFEYGKWKVMLTSMRLSLEARSIPSVHSPAAMLVSRGGTRSLITMPMSAFRSSIFWFGRSRVDEAWAFPTNVPGNFDTGVVAHTFGNIGLKMFFWGLSVQGNWLSQLRKLGAKRWSGSSEHGVCLWFLSGGACGLTEAEFDSWTREPIGEHSLNVGVQIISGMFCLESSVWQAVAKQTRGFSGSARSHFLWCYLQPLAVDPL